MGIGTLGFLKGASGTMLSSIDAREEAERQLKKQKQLEQFRADLEQQKEMTTATTFQFEKDLESGKLRKVGYTSQGKRLDGTARDATESEIAAELQEEEDRKYTVSNREQTAKRNEQIYNFADEDQRMERETHPLNLQATRAQINASNRSGRSLDGDKGKKANLSEVMDAIMARNAKAIQELSGQEGVPLSDIQAGAWRFAEQRIAKGDSPLALERNFSNYLTELRKKAQGQGSRLDRYKRKAGDSDTTGW